MMGRRYARDQLQPVLKLPYHPVRDFTPIALVGESPNVLVTSPRVQANTVKEFIALAKSKPGQLNYGSSGAGTSVHLSGEFFNSMAAVKTVHVPFKGASEALSALLGGQIDFMFASLSSAMPQVKAGKLKAFAVTGAQRSPSVPDLPTMSEAACRDSLRQRGTAFSVPPAFHHRCRHLEQSFAVRARDKGSAGPFVRFRCRRSAGNA